MNNHKLWNGTGNQAIRLANAVKALRKFLKWHGDMPTLDGKPWNPEHDSGDCLELAVALKIMHRHLTPDKNGGNVVIRANGAVWVDDVPTKKLATDVLVTASVNEVQATRTAIVSVAALMGQAIKD